MLRQGKIFFNNYLMEWKNISPESQACIPKQRIGDLSFYGKSGDGWKNQYCSILRNI
jgi:hypothetical protein